MPRERLYESPFKDVSPTGPRDLFSGSDVERLFEALDHIRHNAGAA